MTPLGLQGELRAAALQEASAFWIRSPCQSPGGAGCKRFAKWDRAGQGEFWNQGVERADTLEGKTVSFHRVL